MTVEDEGYRVRHLVHGERPPTLWLEIEAECRDGDLAVDRLRGAMELVAGQDPANWPDQASWEGQLPDWLLGSFRAEFTPEEIERFRKDWRARVPGVFALSSWLFVMGEREWRWWSSVYYPDTGRLVIKVLIDGFPCGTEDLQHLVRAAGCEVISVG